MSKIFAIANQKGGVGKTTTTASLGTILANRGYRVLLVDLDAQANLTTSLLQIEPSVEISIYSAMRVKRGQLPIVPVPSTPNLSLVGSSIEMASIEMELSSRISRESVLKDLLKPHLKDFDIILLDCSPALGLLTINAFVAAEAVLIPMTAETLPFRGLELISQSIDMVREHLNEKLRISGVVITRWNSRNLNKVVESTLRTSGRYYVYSSHIRENIAIAEAPSMSASITAYAPQSNGAKDYQSLADEFIEHEQL
jgi:chromosome partitioning protein